MTKKIKKQYKKSLNKKANNSGMIIENYDQESDSQSQQESQDNDQNQSYAERYSDEEFDSENAQVSQEPKKIVKLKLKSMQGLIEKIKKKTTLNNIGSFIKIFRFVVNEDTENKEYNDEYQDDSKNISKTRFLIEDSEVYNCIMVFSLKEFPIVLQKILKIDDDLETVLQIKNVKLQILLRVYLTNYLKFMQSLNEDQMIIFCLKGLKNLVRIIVSQPVFFRKYMNFLTEIWAGSDNIQLKLNSFVVLQQIGLTLKDKEFDNFLKKMYVTYVGFTKFVNWRNYELITFMVNCFKELLQINMQSSYFVAFGFIRQIAVHLKNSHKDKSKENIHKIFNWQYMNCIKLWISSVCQYGSQDQLGQLAHPLIQICDGMIGLFYTEKYFPLYLQIIQMKNELSEKTGLYVPNFQILIKMLKCSKFRVKKKQQQAQPFDFFTNLKIQKKYIAQNSLWNQLFLKIMDLIIQTLAIYSKSIYFPEQATLLIHDLKLIKKELSFKFYKFKLQNIIKLVENHSVQISNMRIEQNLTPQSKIDFNCSNNNLLIKESQEIQKEIREQILQNVKMNQDQQSDEISIKNKRKNVEINDDEDNNDQEGSQFDDQISQDYDDDNDNQEDEEFDEEMFKPSAKIIKNKNKKQNDSGSDFSQEDEKNMDDYEELEGDDVDGKLEGNEFLSEDDEDN